jgi:hypothetical protein
MHLGWTVIMNTGLEFENLADEEHPQIVVYRERGDVKYSVGCISLVNGLLQFCPNKDETFVSKELFHIFEQITEHAFNIRDYGKPFTKADMERLAHFGKSSRCPSCTGDHDHDFSSCTLTRADLNYDPEIPPEDR